MSREAYRRLLGLFLLALFLVGGPGVPGLDAVLYHRAGQSARQNRNRHVEAAGSNCHAERCLISLAAVSHGNAPLPGAAVVLARPADRRMPLPVASPGLARDFPPLHLPRSPPRSLS